MLAVAFGGLVVNAAGLWILRGGHDANLSMRALASVLIGLLVIYSSWSVIQ